MLKTKLFDIEGYKILVKKVSNKYTVEFYNGLVYVMYSHMKTKPTLTFLTVLVRALKELGNEQERNTNTDTE